MFFDMPIRGSVLLLLVALGVFIASNLALGVTFSTLAGNQMQAMQLAQFTLMPSLPAVGLHVSRSAACRNGRNGWARSFPTTHAMRIVRGILLKGNGLERDRARPLADRAVRRAW